MNRTPIRIELTRQERQELEARTRSQRMAHRDVLRARIILLLAEGRTVSSVARQVSKQRRIVAKWGNRFVKKGLEGLQDESGRGRAPVFSPGGGIVSDQTRMRAA